MMFSPERGLNTGIPEGASAVTLSASGIQLQLVQALSCSPCVNVQWPGRKDTVAVLWVERGQASVKNGKKVKGLDNPTTPWGTDKNTEQEHRGKYKPLSEWSG